MLLRHMYVLKNIGMRASSDGSVMCLQRRTSKVCYTNSDAVMLGPHDLRYIKSRMSSFLFFKNMMICYCALLYFDTLLTSLIVIP